MKTCICPTCGCSLVRLGIPKDQAAVYHHNGDEHFFCCQGCADLFRTDPQQYLRETKDLVVCPTCLAEKSLSKSVALQITGQEVHFCRCPYCAKAFQKNPDYYLKRLAGVLPFKGVLDYEGCCIRPE